MRILLATDQREASFGAIRLAVTLAEDLGAQVEVLRVLHSVPVIGEGVALGALPFDHDGTHDRVEDGRTELEETLREFGPTAISWPRHIESGPVPYTIIQAASRMDASLILLGAGRHAIQDRWLGTETALRVMQLSHLPVLAVPPEGGERPRRVVTAVDFSRFSRDALEAALMIADPGAEVHLIHVLWPLMVEPPYVQKSGWDKRARERALTELQEWAEKTGFLGRFDVHYHVTEGRVADEILGLAEQTEADLIVGGSHGHGFVGRLLFGSVAKGLIRRAHGAVLIAPPPEPAELAAPAEGASATTVG